MATTIAVCLAVSSKNRSGSKNAWIWNSCDGLGQCMTVIGDCIIAVAARMPGSGLAVMGPWVGCDCCIIAVAISHTRHSSCLKSQG